MNIAVAGLGFMGRTHLGVYTKLPDVRIAAIYSRNSGTTPANARGNLNRPTADYDLSSVPRYRRWEDLIGNPGIDAIDICLPTDQHARAAIAALEAGKHVFCEKPMALTEADCDQMIAAAEKTGRVLMIGHVLRFFPEYGYLQELSQSGEYGPVLSAMFIRTCGLPDWSAWLPDESRSGGAILDLLIHDLDQIIELFGMPDRITCKRLPGPNSVSASFLYPSRTEVRLQGGWLQAGIPFSMSFQVRFSGAILEFHSGALYISDQTGQRRQLDFPESDAFEEELAYFVGCCRTGNPPLRCPPQQSAEAVKLALRLKQSRDLGGEQIKC